MICQICGQEIHGKPYLWNDNPTLPMHSDMRRCGPGGAQAFADWMNRNREYINRQGPPVLLESEGNHANPS